MANIFQNIRDLWNGKTPITGNLYNQAAYSFMNGQTAQYDYNSGTYLEKGFGSNPYVYAIITQQSNKVKSIPYCVKKVSDKTYKYQYDRLKIATKGNYSTEQLARKKLLETKAFEEKELPFPLDEPNPNQTWAEIFALYQVYLKTTGNVYFYLLSPTDGNNAGKPTEFYILPSHLVKIVLRKDAEMIQAESVISHYMLIEGTQYIEFSEENVIHIKYPNPFFSLDGSHLYGLSPIRAALRNLESSNDALNHNVKMMKNGGVFGFITSADAQIPFTPEQAVQIKEKLMEMDSSPGRLSRIAGAATPIQFTKLSLDTNELKQFDFLAYDQKTFCNVLGWSDKLLNNDESLTYDNLQNERKRVIIDTINPDLVLLADALNKDFIPRFKGYENCEIEWDITELPEMQEDYAKMVEWLNNAPVTPNEFRQALKYETLEDEGMNVVWLPAGKKRIDDAGMTDTEINKSWDLIQK